MKKLVKFLFIAVTAILLFVFIEDMQDSGYQPRYNYGYNNITTTKTSTTYATKNRYTKNNAAKTTATKTQTKQVVDTRVPDYQGTETDYREVKYTWITHDNREAYMILNIDYNVYKYYGGLDRYYLEQEYPNYVKDAYSKAYAKQVVGALKDIQIQAGYSDYELVLEAMNFVQSCITYKTDSNGNYPQYIIETLYKGTGDCEDVSMLMAAIFKEMGYGSVLLLYSDHMAVGIKADKSREGVYYEYAGDAYYYVEATNTGWGIGQVPKDYEGKSAIVLNVW
ncbi:MAG: transglutaminase domain-containing protein [Lachnospiraceae bacterium]|nr:transglutaminase domain-containing protein [Lachnospiraceae bacterium]